MNKKVRLLKKGRLPEVVLTSDSDESKCDTVTVEEMRYFYKKSIHHIDPTQSATLKKRIIKREDQSTNMTASNLTLDTALLPSKQCSTHLCKGHQEKEGQHKAPHTHTHTHTKQLNFMQCFPILFYKK